jgi:hypothetical protein
MKIRVLKSDATLRSSDATSLRSTRKGIVLVAVLVFTLILTILGFSVLTVANSEIVLAQKAVDETKAFYLAEAGVEIFSTKLSSGEIRGGQSGSIEGDLGEGSYRVDYYSDGNAIATGMAGGQEKGIKVAVSFLAPPYDCGIYAGGLGGEQWTLMLRGIGNPVSSGGREYGGKDIINGNIFVDGNVALYQQSSINPAPAPNTYELDGDVNATGNVNRYDSATVSGEITEGAEPQDPPDLLGMNYAVNNTHNVAQYFTDAGASHTLPVGNPLRNVFQKNPTNRSTECSSTTGNDYFLEPVTVTGGGGEKEARTPLHLGNDRVYYVDGDVWVHNKTTYGFKIDGKVTIVATGNIHICDNLLYADSSSMLGLVALGKYDGSGQRISGGDFFFGDPIYGTMYTVSSMMFAANDFLYNSAVATRKPEEPTSGFTVTGNLSALNNVSIERDWYTNAANARRPAHYDPVTSKWYDSGTEVVLTSTQISTMKHYQMKLNYDERVRNRDTQPPSLPRGVGFIFTGLTNWKEL